METSISWPSVAWDIHPEASLEFLEDFGNFLDVVVLYLL